MVAQATDEMAPGTRLAVTTTPEARRKNATEAGGRKRKKKREREEREGERERAVSYTHLTLPTIHLV